MRKGAFLLIVLLPFLLPFHLIGGSTNVRGHYRDTDGDGVKETYVRPHYRNYSPQPTKDYFAVNSNAGFPASKGTTHQPGNFSKDSNDGKNNEGVFHNPVKLNSETNRKFIDPKFQYFCKRAVDGDTIIILIEGREEKVRLIGVDTPETVHPQKKVEYFGKEASEFTRTMVEGNFVRIKFDWQKRDKFGRLLAYVILANGALLNEEIIRQGYGFAYTKYPFEHLEDFRDIERVARFQKKGLWDK